MNIGSKIRALRLDRDMTTPEVAAKANVTQSTISEVENDNRSPSLNTLEKICNALNVPIMEVLPIEHHLGLLRYSISQDEKNILTYLHSLTKEEREIWFDAYNIVKKMPLNEKKQFIATNGYSFTKEEKELLDIYSQLSQEERKNFYALFSSLLKSKK
ncbi:helix-turn-helix domain-containing protein [Paenibacillus prosopidis]|uniref:DNA-binding XRE family transcriptional regulator n=1 Tax=Paenibacillus prosopidis TaxID=630520 RepID=A0A368VLA2_9BACL|nr:helix-turn-helix transcriptional regulator [Paenibacillus prosopidis]RCW41649.1 DNA-binding XRE family transcriptional regulator [Paenibacillus prosopidis]